MGFDWQMLLKHINICSVYCVKTAISVTIYEINKLMLSVTRPQGTSKGERKNQHQTQG